MHKSLYLTLVAALVSTGCLGTLSNSERDELTRLRQKDYDARVQRAREDGYRPPGAPQMPATSPKPPDVSGSLASGNASGGIGQVGGTAATSEVVLGEKPAYLCVTGSEPRQVRLGRKLQLVNNYCNGRRDGGLNCADSNYDGHADNDSLLVFEINGKPVATDTGGVLKPTQMCYVDVGRNRRIELKVMRFTNIGTHRVPKIDPMSVDSSYTVWIDLDGNNTLHDITENKAWSSR